MLFLQTCPSAVLSWRQQAQLPETLKSNHGLSEVNLNVHLVLIICSGKREIKSMFKDLGTILKAKASFWSVGKHPVLYGAKAQHTSSLL